MPLHHEVKLMARIILPPLHRTIGWLLRATAIVLPLSVKLYSPIPDLEVIFPAEPLIGSAVLLIIAEFIFQRGRLSLDGAFLKHPITLGILGYLMASLISAAASTMPMVSVKAILVRVSYLVAFYFIIGIRRTASTPEPAGLLRFYAIAFLPVVLYSFANQVGVGLDRAGAGFVSFPFYTDHTIYAAAMTFVLFQFAAAAVHARKEPDALGKTIFFFLITFVLADVLYFSFCRAAWVSVVLASPLLLALLPRRLALRIATVAAMLLIGGGLVWGDRIVKSSVDANAYGSGARENLLSLTNTVTDPSNMERINRWSCAWRMFRDRPMLGSGPGTYQFQYIDYQLPEEISPLSIVGAVDPGLITRSVTISKKLYVRSNPQVHQYSGGTAHSEYLLALSESGAFACAALTMVVILSIWKGVRLMSKVGDPHGRSLAAAATLGLAAYAVHAVFNNYLDDCKVAFLFWTSIALIVKMDLERSRSDRSPYGAAG